MTIRELDPRLQKERRVQMLALCLLLMLGFLSIAGPAGLLAWSENNALLEQRQAEINRLEARRDELRNRVALLDPNSADPDLVGELLRENLNVAHPDELVLDLSE
jgi:cell division protein FtsB